jgi:hypothetical protein
MKPMNEEEEKNSGDLYGYKVTLTPSLEDEFWVVDVDIIGSGLIGYKSSKHVYGYELETYDEALTEYNSEVNYLCNHKEPNLSAWNNFLV